jgi:hypothetical protein
MTEDQVVRFETSVKELEETVDANDAGTFSLQNGKMNAVLSTHSYNFLSPAEYVDVEARQEPVMSQYDIELAIMKARHEEEWEPWQNKMDELEKAKDDELNDLRHTKDSMSDLKYHNKRANIVAKHDSLISAHNDVGDEIRARHEQELADFQNRFDEDMTPYVTEQVKVLERQQDQELGMELDMNSISLDWNPSVSDQRPSLRRSKSTSWSWELPSRLPFLLS